MEINKTEIINSSTRDCFRASIKSNFDGYLLCEKRSFQILVNSLCVLFSSLISSFVVEVLTIFDFFSYTE